MGLLSRSKSAKPFLNGLTTLPAAAAALQGVGLRPTGVGAVCVKPIEGGIVSGSEKFEMSTDEYGHNWLTRRTSPDAIQQLTDDIHELVVAGEEAGFGSALLCVLVPFTGGGKPDVALIYRFSRGTWYPFAPVGTDQRDNVRELELRTQLGTDVPIEKDLTRWAPVWGAPGL